MAEGKKSFVLYCDQRIAFDSLTDEQAGKLIKLIFSYVNDEDPDIPFDIVGYGFKMLKPTLKRDLQKYQERVDRIKKNGKQFQTDVEESKTDVAPISDRNRNEVGGVNVNVNVNDNVNDNVNVLSDITDITDIKKKSDDSDYAPLPLIKKLIELSYIPNDKGVYYDYNIYLEELAENYTTKIIRSTFHYFVDKYKEMLDSGTSNKIKDRLNYFKITMKNNCEKMLSNNEKEKEEDNWVFNY